MLSQKCKYALQALLVLARENSDELLLVSDIAERENLPKKFLEAILLELNRNGLVRSRRGRGGGYALAKPADLITFGQVVRIMDGPLAPLSCVSVNYYRRCDDCKDEQACEILQGDAPSPGCDRQRAGWHVARPGIDGRESPGGSGVLNTIPIDLIGL